jgi:hypothetical protein
VTASAADVVEIILAGGVEVTFGTSPDGYDVARWAVLDGELRVEIELCDRAGTCELTVTENGREAGVYQLPSGSDALAVLAELGLYVPVPPQQRRPPAAVEASPNFV